jgi:hypothetical protein
VTFAVGVQHRCNHSKLFCAGYPAEPLVDDLDALCRRFLTDAIAAGHTLDEVNERWTDVEAEIARALRAVAGDP